jgi:hypothetical protein
MSLAEGSRVRGRCRQRQSMVPLEPASLSLDPRGRAHSARAHSLRRQRLKGSGRGGIEFGPVELLLPITFDYAASKCIEHAVSIMTLAL